MLQKLRLKQRKGQSQFRIIIGTRSQIMFKCTLVLLLLSISVNISLAEWKRTSVADHPATSFLPEEGAGNFKTIPVHNAREIAQAMKSALPGDTLVMQAGRWLDQQIVFEGKGRPGARIVLRAAAPGQTVLCGNSTLSIAGAYLTVDGLVFRNGAAARDVIEFRSGKQVASHCRLTNCVIRDYNPPNAKTDNKWVSLYGAGNRVDHCFIKGKTNAGTTLVVWLDGQPTYHRIDHNYFGHRPALGTNGGETIRIGTSTWSLTDACATIEDNYFEKCDGEIEIISNKSGHNIIRHNTFFACQGTLTLRHGNYARVEGNFFFGDNINGTGGIRVIGNHHVIVNNYLQDLTGTSLKAAISLMNTQAHPVLSGYSPVDSVLVANNTMVHCKEGLVIGSGAGQRERVVAPNHCLIINNLIWSKTGRLLNFITKPVNTCFEANVIYGIKPQIAIPVGFAFNNPMLQKDLSGDFPLYRPNAGNTKRKAPKSILLNKGVALPRASLLGQSSNHLFDSKTHKGNSIRTAEVLKSASSRPNHNQQPVFYDMDQQLRADGQIDIGADEWINTEKNANQSASVMQPPSAHTTGPVWMQKDKYDR